MSRYPLTDLEVFNEPVSMRATMRFGDGDVAIHTAHPYPAVIETVTPFRLPIGYDPATRDVDLLRLRERIQVDIDAGRPTILLGDLNVAPTEPAYLDLIDGLEDAHQTTGIGPGWTWRPSRLELLGIGVLRIDHVLSSGMRAVSSREQCHRAGDHCLVIVEMENP